MQTPKSPILFMFYFMSRQYRMREYPLNGLISGRNLDKLVRMFDTAAVFFQTYFIIAF